MKNILQLYDLINQYYESTYLANILTSGDLNQSQDVQWIS